MMQTLAAWIDLFAQEARSPLGVVVFIIGYVSAVALMIPGMPFTMLAGVLYGLPGGMLAASLSATLGASVAFLLGRWVLHDWVKRRFGHAHWLKTLEQAIARNGLHMVILLRLAVFIPFAAVNYGLSLTHVGLGTFALGSFLGMLLPVGLVVAVGATAGTLTRALAGVQDGNLETVGLLVQCLAIVSLALLVVLLRRAARRQTPR
ncbi:MAG: VTT domain-containing protein [Myxococcota bacterium]